MATSSRTAPAAAEATRTPPGAGAGTRARGGGAAEGRGPPGAWADAAPSPLFGTRSHPPTHLEESTPAVRSQINKTRSSNLRGRCSQLPVVQLYRSGKLRLSEQACGGSSGGRPATLAIWTINLSIFPSAGNHHPPSGWSPLPGAGVSQQGQPPRGQGP